MKYCVHVSTCRGFWTGWYFDFWIVALCNIFTLRLQFQSDNNFLKLYCSKTWQHFLKGSWSVTWSVCRNTCRILMVWSHDVALVFTYAYFPLCTCHHSLMSHFFFLCVRVDNLVDLEVMPRFMGRHLLNSASWEHIWFATLDGRADQIQASVFVTLLRTSLKFDYKTTRLRSLLESWNQVARIHTAREIVKVFAVLSYRIDGPSKDGWKSQRLTKFPKYVGLLEWLTLRVLSPSFHASFNPIAS